MPSPFTPINIYCVRVLSEITLSDLTLTALHWNNLPGVVYLSLTLCVLALCTCLSPGVC